MKFLLYKFLLLFSLFLMLNSNAVVKAADNTVILTPGTGVTMRSIDIGAGVQSSGVNLVGSTGASILGTAGTANANVVTVQGIASGTPQPVTLTSTTITGTVAATQSGTWNITNVSGTISLPTGASTSAKQPAFGTAGTASSDVITVQGKTSMVPLDINITQVNSTPLSTSALSVSLDNANITLGVNTNFGNSPASVGNGTSDSTTQRVAIASNNTAFSVNATLAAETTKVIGTINVAAAQTIAATNAGTFATQSQPTPVTSGGLTWYFVQPAASDNHVVIKAGAGQVYNIQAFNNSATVNYLRLYNATTGFNGCNSATNLVGQWQIPASTSVGGLGMNIPMGIAFSTGISICVTSAYATTDTTNATASAMSVNIGYK